MSDTDSQQALTAAHTYEMLALYQKDKALAPELLENPNIFRALLLEIIKDQHDGNFDAWSEHAKNIQDTIQRDPSYLRKRVSAALQRAKSKKTAERSRASDDDYN